MHLKLPYVFSIKEIVKFHSGDSLNEMNMKFYTTLCIHWLCRINIFRLNEHSLDVVVECIAQISIDDKEKRAAESKSVFL